MIYTPQTIAIIQQHYNVDRTAAQIAEMIGTTADRLRKNVDRLRNCGHVFAAKSKPIGTVTTWNGIPYVKGEDGFKPIRRRNVYKVGDTREQRKKDGTIDRYLKTADGGWVYVPKEIRAKTGRKPYAAQAVKGALPADTLRGSEKRAASKAEGANRTTKPNYHTPTKRVSGSSGRAMEFATGCNPETVIVKKHTDGRWTRVDNRTWKFIPVSDASPHPASSSR